MIDESPHAGAPSRLDPLERLAQLPAWITLDLTEEQKQAIRAATGCTGDALFLHLAELLSDRFTPVGRTLG